MTFEPPSARALHDAAHADAGAIAGDGDARLDDVATLAALAFDAPGGLIATADEMGVRVVGAHGPGQRHGLLPRTHPMARHWDQHAPLLALPQLPSEPQGGLRFYVGIALRAPGGQRLGTLAVCAANPAAPPTPAQLDALDRLGRIASALLEQRHIERRATIVTQAGEQAREAVLIGDRHGRVRWHNRAAERLFGPPLDGRPLSSLFPSGLQADRDLAEAWLEGQREESRQLRIVAVDGSLRLLDATRSTWRHGPDAGTTLILHDVTEAAAQRAQLDRLAH